MPTHTIHSQKGAVFFVTFTCYKWLPLFEKTQMYDQFDKWFSVLEERQTSVLGYVIMPNHFHGLLHLGDACDTTLNTLVSNGKRFLAYEIVRRLEDINDSSTLRRLSYGVTKSEKERGKKHKVFRPSFDAKLCFSRGMLETKLDYIHANPVSGKWNLSEDWAAYPYSSAAFYEYGKTDSFLKDYRDFV